MAESYSESENKGIQSTLLHGRRRIVCGEQNITATNVREVLDRSTMVHGCNSSDIDYLWRYFLGYQPVIDRKKEVRPEIKNIVLENRAYQIAKDRADSLAGEPIAYSAHGSSKDCEDVEQVNDELSHKVQQLNDFCIAADKHACDMEIVQWMCVCGVGYRLVLPNSGDGKTIDDEQPFKVASLDPRRTFVVYTNDAFHEPLYAVTYVRDDVTNEPIYSVYTDRLVFTVDSDSVKTAANPLGMVPIIEYDANSERMGVFEAVLSLLDAINEIESNRVDAIAQFVQALLVLENVEFEDDDAETGFKKLMEMGCLQIRSTDENKASVQMLTSELNQDQTQTLVDALYKTALSICGMPFNVGGSGSTSDTGAAVTMRDGWSNSESRCKETEVHFKRGERLFLQAVATILDTSVNLGLRPRDVDIKFTRRNYEAIQSKAQVLSTILGCGKVHPRLAFEYCGMFPDPETAYDLSKSYADEQAQRQMELAQAKSVNPGDDSGADSNAGKPGESAGGSVSAAGKGTRPPSTKRSQGKESN